jgi:photosystem II stability/assembly factor-like uncharacterized protein
MAHLALSLVVGVALTACSSGTNLAPWSAKGLLPGSKPGPNELFSVSLLDLSCPTTSHCVLVGDSETIQAAVGPSVFVTWNGGASWSVGRGSAGIELTHVTCASDRYCVAIGAHYIPETNGPDTAVVIFTADGGRSWRKATTLPVVTANLTAVSCPTAADCMVTADTSSGAEVLISKDDGQAWRKDYLPSLVSTLGAMSCATTRHCVAIDSANGGNVGMLISRVDRPGFFRGPCLPDTINFTMLSCCA